MRYQDALEQLARETQRAKHRLMLERGLRAGLLLLFALGAWAAFALYGGHEALPLLAQSLSAAAALVGFVWLAWRAKRAWRAPTEDEARARLADDLAHALGKHHDIAVCIDRLKDDRALLCHPDEREPLLALAGRESVALEDRVHLLAGRLLAEPADAFIGHWQALWANWQASGDEPALPGENPEYQTSWASDWGSKPSS